MPYDIQQFPKLIILDKDGTLVKELPDPKLGTRPANTPDEQVLLPGVSNVIACLKALGIDVAIATNQGGVSHGFITMQEARLLVDDAALKAGIDPQEAIFCPYDPRGKYADHYLDYANWRKPRSGMLRHLMGNLKPHEVIYVGDRDTDKAAADAIEVRFIWAKDFFGWEDSHDAS